MSYFQGNYNSFPYINTIFIKFRHSIIGIFIDRNSDCQIFILLVVDCQTIRLSVCETIRLSNFQTFRLTYYQIIRILDSQTLILSDTPTVSYSTTDSTYDRYLKLYKELGELWKTCMAPSYFETMRYVCIYGINQLY